MEEFLSYGFQHLFLVLKQTGIILCSTAFYGVMKRYGLNHCKDRLEWVRRLRGEEIQPSDLETDRQKPSTDTFKRSSRVIWSA